MNDKQLAIYYDGLCPLCSREINHYRQRDIKNKIEYVDISDPEFNARAMGLDPEAVQKVLHIKTKSGIILTKVDAFIAIWDTLEIFSPLSVLAKNRLFRPLFDLGYFAFAKVRPYLPKKECANGSCKT